MAPAMFPFGGPLPRPLSRVDQRTRSFCLSVSGLVAPSAPLAYEGSLPGKLSIDARHHSQRNLRLPAAVAEETMPVSHTARKICAD